MGIIKINATTNENDELAECEIEVDGVTIENIARLFGGILASHAKRNSESDEEAAKIVAYTSLAVPQYTAAYFTQLTEDAATDDDDKA